MASSLNRAHGLVAGGTDVQAVREQFRRWRQARKKGTRIPEELWQAAVSLSRRHSYYEISRALGLDYVDVRRRAERTAASKREGKSARAAFVELQMPGTSSVEECRLRAEDGRGRKVEVELKGLGVREVVQLLGGLWGESS